MSDDEGHEELQQAVHDAWDAHQQCTFSVREAKFRECVLAALKNLTWRVHQLEGYLDDAHETIARLEGK